MSLEIFGLFAAFSAGIVSFLSPCVLPLVPGYLAYLAGTGVSEAQAKEIERWRIMTHALCFVLGFVVIFVLLGMLASLLGTLLLPYREWLARIAGALLILFGLLLTGLVPLPWFLQEYRLQATPGTPLRSTLIGMAFAAGWSPCMGPVLASILALIAVNGAIFQGAFFLFIYALGLGLPFLIVGAFVDRARPLLRQLNRYTRPLALVGGILLVFLGMLMLTGSLAQLSQYAPFFNI